MASVSNDPNGRKRILFNDLEGVRRTLRVGKMDRRTAEAIARHIENLLSARKAGQPVPRETTVWLEGVAEALRDKMTGLGLIDLGPKVPTLGEYSRSYLERHARAVKPGSLLVVEQAVESALAFWGGSKPLDKVTPGEAQDLRRWMLTEGRSRVQKNKPAGLSKATTNKRLQWMSHLFRDAVRRKIITANPFEEVKMGAAVNHEREAYIPAEVINVLIERHAPSAEWRLLLALSRFLGVRVPSEPFSMTWDCVDWEKQRLRVPSPKTETHGKAFRLVPILPEVMPHLREVFELAPEGATHVFHHLRQRESVRRGDQGTWSAVNIRKGLLTMLRRAGITPWPRIWHALRASAQTDLTEKFPAHVVCQWIGNTTRIANQHYLRVTDEHFQRASAGEDKGGAKSGAPVAQNAARQMSALEGKERSELAQTPGSKEFMPLNSATFPHMPISNVAAPGFEPGPCRF